MFPIVAMGEKRKLDDLPDESSSAKLPKLKEEINILDFSDCVLVEILSHLDSTSLFAISKTCTRFEYLMHEKRLWRHVDFRDRSMPESQFNYFLEKHLHSGTTRLKLKGTSKRECVLSLEDVKSKCPELKIMYLEYQRMQTLSWPDNLVELALVDCIVKNQREFSRGIENSLVNLKTLVLDKCKWVTSYTLLSVSKLQKLEVLSLVGCKYFYDSLAYMSLTSRYGFKSLQKVDVRNTLCGDQFLESFSRLPSIKEIYMQYPAGDDEYDPDFIPYVDTVHVEVAPNVWIYQNNDILREIRKRGRIVSLHRRPPIDSDSDGDSDCEDCNLEAMALEAPSRKKSLLTDNALISMGTLYTDTVQAPVNDYELYKPPFSRACDCSFKHRSDKLPSGHHDNPNAAGTSGFPESGSDSRPGTSSSASNAYMPQLYIQLEPGTGRIVIGRRTSSYSKLDALMIRNYKTVTNMTVMKLRNYGLALLDVTGTAVTEAAVRRFAEDNPDCRVVHESTCTCDPC